MGRRREYNRKGPKPFRLMDSAAVVSTLFPRLAVEGLQGQAGMCWLSCGHMCGTFRSPLEGGFSLPTSLTFCDPPALSARTPCLGRLSPRVGLIHFFPWHWFGLWEVHPFPSKLCSSFTSWGWPGLPCSASHFQRYPGGCDPFPSKF